MHRWRSAALMLVLVLLCGTRGGAQALDPDDNFNDGVIDTAKWGSGADPGASLTEAGGQLVMSMDPTDLGYDIGALVYSTYRLRGPFDIQTDYQLIEWPAQNNAVVALSADPYPNDFNALERVSGQPSDWGGTGEVYLTQFMPGSGGEVGGVTPTDDIAGKLRLVRDADSVLYGYVWQADTQEWVLIHSQQVSGDDVMVVLHCWGNVAAPAVIAFDNFLVNSGEVIQYAPTIEDVVLDRGRDTDWWDWSMWHTRFTVQVKGTDYEQPTMLLVDEPQGSRYVLQTDGSWWWDPFGPNPGGSCDVRVTEGPDYTYTYTWYEARKQYPIPEGSYRFTVVGSAGSQPSLTTAVLPAVPEEGPVLSGPAADSVIATTTPTFEWTPLPGSEQILKVRAEGATNYTGPLPEQDDCGQIWRVALSPTEPASVVYNFDDTGPDLEPGRTYFWEVDAWTPVDDRVSDPRVSVWMEQTARHRFTVNTTWPALPALPGKLAYEQTMYGDTSDPYNLQAILQYGTTPAARKWVGPDASHTPSYSWDGTKIAYRISDWGIRVANADGSDPVRLPAMWGWYGADLSPDATWITYADGEWQGSEPQHIFIQKLFEPERTLLVRARGERAWDPHWSPDGVWISYLSCCDPSGHYVWLIHPGGTGDHPVLATGVAGYPGGTITWYADAPVWSPDAKRLSTRFALTTAEGASLTGIGTMLREGGEITPVWIDPPDVVCCAAARIQTWSPDGTFVVFGSAHQVPVDAGWADAKFEPGVELWLISADGTGEPTRLTYDYSNNPSAAWWAPNTPAGSNVAITKGEATVTFDAVSAGGSTAVFVVPDRPGTVPEQFSSAGDCWEVLTNAAHSGDITVQLRYLPTALPAGTEEVALRLLAWDGDEWRNITTSVDTTNDAVQGECAALSRFTLAIAQTHFDDIAPGFWAFDAISACADAGIVQGYWDHTYRPNIEVNRGQMAVYIARALAGGETHVPTGATSVSFDDIPTDHWAYKYVEYCADNDIVVGYWDGTYRPDEVVNRGQMAVYVARAIATPTGEAGVPDPLPDEEPAFWDVTAENDWSWCFKYVQYIAERGIVQGYWDGSYRPANAVTRDQMAAYVQRAFELPL